MEDRCRKFHTRASLLSCRARPVPRWRLGGRRGLRHCRSMTTSSLWSRRTRILNKSSGASLTRRISGNWRQKAPYSTAWCIYARKHVPWISFANVPNGTTIDTSSNLRFADFPSDYATLPTVAFVIPNLNHDMHNGKPAQSIPAGDAWLQQNLDGFYQWAKTHNSLLIVTLDENDDQGGYYGLTNPLIGPNPRYSPRYNRLLRDI